MLKWKVKTGDEKLKKTIQKVEDGFDSWISNFHHMSVTRGEVLSGKSKFEQVYYMMTKSLDEIKEKYPLEAKEKCSSCGEYVDRWLCAEFSFCGEYECGLNMCKDCIEKTKLIFDEFLN